MCSLIRPIVPSTVHRGGEEEEGGLGGWGVGEKWEGEKTVRKKESGDLSAQSAHCNPNSSRLSDNGVKADFV